MKLKLLSVFLFVSKIICIYSSKILAVFPVPSISHQVVFRPLIQELVQRGHEVTVITPDPSYSKGFAPPNLKEIDVHDISYKTWRDSYMDNYKADGTSTNFNVVRQKWSLLAKIVKMQLHTQEVQNIINDKNIKYDLIFIEAMIRPALIYSYIFKAPVILISSLGAILSNQKIMGLHTHPIFYSSPLQKRIYNLTLIEKLKELYTFYSIELADYFNEVDENTLLRNTFGPSIPPLSELYKNIDMLFVNTYPIWVDNQPAPPTVIYIGGIHRVPEKELPEDIKTFLDTSKLGAIYISFGTNALSTTIPRDKIRIIAKVLSELPYDVLWKWDKNELPEQAHNIKLSKWFPQSDLLRHPKVKLFITQAGLQSTYEAITAGVPLLAIPMLGDQWYNAEKYVKHGIGNKINIESLTVTELKNAIESLIRDKSYRENITKLREILKDQQESSLQRAIWWTEYVIRHGGAKHLRPPSANMSYAEYYQMDILFAVIFALLIILGIILVAIFCILKCINRLFKDTRKEKCQ